MISETKEGQISKPHSSYKVRKPVITDKIDDQTEKGYMFIVDNMHPKNETTYDESNSIEERRINIQENNGSDNTQKALENNFEIYLK